MKTIPALIFFLLLSQCLVFSQAEFGWLAHIRGYPAAPSFAVALDAEGNVISGGTFVGSADFDPGPENYIIESQGSDGYILKLNSEGELIWVVQFTCSGSVEINKVKTDADGNIYATGRFSDTADFNPGPGVYELYADELNDLFTMKLTAEGELVWVKEFGGADYQVVYGVEVDSEGNVYTTGGFRGTVDFDPGPGTINRTATDTYDGFLIKLDAGGNFVWVHVFGGWGESAGMCIDITETGDIYVGGHFDFTVDFAPGPEEFNLTALGDPSGFILKLHQDGSFAWVKELGIGADAYVRGINIDRAGNIFTTGYMDGPVDFDPGPGEYILSVSGDGSNFFVSKLDGNGNFAWAMSAGDNDEYAEGLDITTDEAGFVYVTGYFDWLTDFDPGLGIYNLEAHGKDMFNLKLDNTGNFVWATAAGGYDTETGSGIVVENSTGSVYTTGHFNSYSVDFDPGEGEFLVESLGDDAFIQKLTQDVCDELILSIDSVININCDSYTGYAEVHAYNGYAPYSYSWNTTPVTNDSIMHFTSGGLYDVSVTDNRGCSKSTTMLLEGPTSLSDLDLQVNLVADEFRPGMQTYIDLDGLNNGCVPANGNITLVLDNLLSYEEASPEPDFIIGDTLVWNFSNIIYTSAHVTPWVKVTTSLAAQIDQKLNLHVQIGPQDMDTDTSNNIKDHTFNVVNSFDPNDKQVYPQGVCDKGYILKEKLTYTIRFQNTGNADAINIRITDTLSTKLDINNLRIVGSSHAMYTEVLPGDVLQFVFNDIHLPDSTTNEAESHGYLIYEVDPIASAGVGTKIKNSASIYFDFNEPIITNVTANTITDVIPFYETAQNVTLCTGETITVGDHVYAEPGTYTDQLLTAGGCDSAVTTVLSYLPASFSAIEAAVCYGDSYVFDGIELSEEGIYTAVFPGVSGCDSIVELNLEIIPGINTFLSASICSGETYFFNGEELIAAGVYTANYFSATGCDSVVELNLEIIPSINTFLAASICSGETYSFNGEELIATGIYIANYFSAVGCDSVVELSLEIIPEINTLLTASICSGETYSFNGEELTAAGVYTANYFSTTGCDSVVELSLEIIPETNTLLTASICSGETYSFNGEELTAAGMYTANYFSALGCDSVVELTLEILPDIFTSFSASICEGETYFFNGSELTLPGVYAVNYVSAAGCDSILELTLGVVENKFTALYASVCAGEIYLFDGAELSDAGSYTANYISAAGCDSIVELNLSVQTIDLSVSSDGINISAIAGADAWQWINCDGMLIIPGETGQSFTPIESGTYAVIITVNSCTDTSACETIILDEIKDTESSKKLRIYPNPASDHIFINIEIHEDVALKLVDVSGRIVLLQYLNTLLPEGINISSLSAGVYYMIIQTSESYYTGKFVKE